MSALVVLGLLAGCRSPSHRGEGHSTSLDVERVLLVSEALPNRSVVDTTSIPYRLHGAFCDGFYQKHFDPTVIQAKHFEGGQQMALEQATDLSWRVYPTRDSVINFPHLFPDSDNKVVYVAERIQVAQQEEKVLSIGSDDGFTLWVNGDSVHTVHKGRVLERHSDLLSITLRKGSNVLLYKIDQGDGGWALYRHVYERREVPALIEQLITALYADLVKSAILPDTTRYIPLKPDARRQFDTAHTIRFRWYGLHEASCGDSASDHTLSYPANRLPERIALPEGFDGQAVLDVVVEHEPEGTEYAERFYVFAHSTAHRLATSLTRADGNVSTDPVLEARRVAVRELFGLGDAGNQHRTYSTRMRAHALADLVLYKADATPERHCSPRPGPTVQGYRALPSHTVQTYRVFVPTPLSDRQRTLSSPPPLVFLSYGVLSQPSFWAGKEGGSHTLTAQRAALSTQAGVLIAMPHGQGEEHYAADFPAISKALAEIGYVADSTEASILAFSLGAISLLDAMITRRLPFCMVGIVSPVLAREEVKMHWQIEQIRTRYPQLAWFIRHGLDDNEAPIHVTRRWVRALREAGFEVDYEEVPHSSHWVYLTNPEREFYQKVRDRYQYALQ